MKLRSLTLAITFHDRPSAANALLDVPRWEIERLLVKQADGTFPEYFTTIKVPTVDDQAGRG